MKPDDVSQEAWDAAIAAQDAAIERCKAERLAYPFPTCNGKAVLDEAIARAITAAVAAERESWKHVATTLSPDPCDERISDGAWFSNADLKTLGSLPSGAKLFTRSTP